MLPGSHVDNADISSKTCNGIKMSDGYRLLDAQQSDDLYTPAAAGACLAVAVGWYGSQSCNSGIQTILQGGIARGIHVPKPRNVRFLYMEPAGSSLSAFPTRAGDQSG